MIKLCAKKKKERNKKTLANNNISDPNIRRNLTFVSIGKSWTITSAFPAVSTLWWHFSILVSGIFHEKTTIIFMKVSRGHWSTTSASSPHFWKKRLYPCSQYIGINGTKMVKIVHYPFYIDARNFLSAANFKGLLQKWLPLLSLALC